MKKSSFWARLLLPILIMAFLAGAILLEKRGTASEAQEAVLEILDAVPGNAGQGADPNPGVLVLYHSEDAFGTESMNALSDTLQAMRIGFRAVDLSEEPFPSLDDVSMLLTSTYSLEPFEAGLEGFIKWIETGGKFGIMRAPAIDSTFRVLYRKLGIIDFGYENRKYTSLRYTSGLLPQWGDLMFDEGLQDYTMTVRLEPDCIVHIESADSQKTPLLWERTLGKGRIAVLNNSLLSDKDSRGFAAAVLFALEDTLIYPIINTGVFYVDDFPAPQPEGFDEILLDHYGYNIQGVFRNRWWPDMKSLTQRLGLRYTGVLIERYSDNVEPPFEPGTTDTSLFRFYASELLHSGGEIGIHGYNHMPLSPPGFPYKDEAYQTWPSSENMQASIREALRYGKQMMPGAKFTTYVPPSNYLSDEGLEALLAAFPGLRVISGLYLREEGTAAFVQEFREEENGTISLPRVSSGFVADSYTRFIIAQELLLHGVFSHFIHPDDILDESRGANLGWEEMYRDFSQLLESIASTYPNLRFSTATEGAAAVQRYDRLGLMREEGEGALTVALSNFYDTAWLALRTRRTITSIQGGEVFRVDDGFYWIRADKPNVVISWEQGV